LFLLHMYFLVLFARDDSISRVYLFPPYINCNFNLGGIFVCAEHNL
jgi:hypothetical protein